MKVIEIKEQCKSCGGTGLFVGMGERDGAAVVCHTCNGTGCHEFRHEYEEFTERKARQGVKRVFAANPGVCIGDGIDCKIEDFGGIPVTDWEKGEPFQQDSEMRKFTCPAWWNQCTGGDNTPFKKCWDAMGRSFSGCPHFACKAKCWAEFDAMQST
jgi:hypothetical protein